MDSPTRPPPPPVAPKPSPKLIALKAANNSNSPPLQLEKGVDVETTSQASCSSVMNVGQLQQPAPAKTSSEKELADLTSQLLLNMEKVSSEPEFVGVCSRCNEIIQGSHDACTAMDKFYHSTCFTCQTCSRPLSGHSFYAVESRILCEGCYVNTLEKCDVCQLPVTERILRATGKVYHPECFTCTHCKKSLDGVPFTVDAQNKIHCIEDFHMKYAPRCNVCTQPILPDGNAVETVRVVALDRNFHVGCYKCEDCAKVMNTESGDNGCFPLDDHLLCKQCNMARQRQP